MVSRTYGELDLLFKNGVSARNFRTASVTEFETPDGAGAEVSEKEKIDDKFEISHVEHK
jgi:hypothetical protein